MHSTPADQEALAALAELDGLPCVGGLSHLVGQRCLFNGGRPALAILLACAGATVEATTPIATEPGVARALLCALRSAGRWLDPDPLLSAASRADPPSRLRSIGEGEAALSALASGSFDLILAWGPLALEQLSREAARLLVPRGRMIVGGVPPAVAQEALTLAGLTDVRQSGATVTGESIGTPPTEYPREDDAPQTIAHSRARYSLLGRLVPGRRVLDVGCGAGLGTLRLVRMGAAAVEGIDRRPEALELARQAAQREGLGVTWREVDLERGLPHPDGSFDLVVCLEVLEHVEAQEELVRELRRVLTPAGHLVISIPHAPFEAFWEGLGGANPYHHHVPDLVQFRRLLKGFAGLQLFVQSDVVASLLRPLGGALSGLAALSLEEPGELADLGTISIIAVAGPDDLESQALLPHEAWGYGDHQAALGRAMDASQRLERELRALRARVFELESRAKWQGLGYPSGEDEPWVVRLSQHARWMTDGLRRGLRRG